MKYILVVTIVIMSLTSVFAQSGIVPKKMNFADMTLVLNNAARGKIQAEVNKLRRHEKSFQGVVAKANIYFPIVEEIFRQKGFPDDIKYLMIQESGFNAVAVSSSKAVGFWQFKAGTAKEVGLYIGHGVDERKNLVSASRGAAAYMSKTNLKVKNWVYALLSYNVGPGGVMSHVKQKYVGSKKMDITGHTHWYVIKFLAHKIAYESAIHKQKPSVNLLVRMDYTGKTLKQIAKKEGVTLDNLVAYNRWIPSHKKLPGNKKYPVIVPSKKGDKPVFVGGENSNNKPVATKSTPSRSKFPTVYKEEPLKKGDVIRIYESPKENIQYLTNGIKCIVAIDGDNSQRLAIKGGVSKSKFIKYNDIQTFTELKPGVTYFLEKKRKRAQINFHVVKPNQTLWDISQMYGMKIQAIRSKNGISKKQGIRVKKGRVLWLRRTRPSSTPVEYKEVKKETDIKKQKPVVFHNKKEPKVIKKPKEQPKNLPVDRKKDSVRKMKMHRVIAGETLYAISKKYGVSIEAIKEKNQLGSEGISIGMELEIPVKTLNGNEIQREEYYIVKQGDTFYAITRKFNISVEQLKRLNKKQDTSLDIGEKLRVK